MMRALVAGALALSIGTTAPFQCGGGGYESGKPTPNDGDALYDLAQDFHAKGNEEAAKQTLRYLVEHFPSNRHVPAARAELGESK
ncbi:MAG: hypothetical protein KIT84_23830 [Labilithrix sp.]|nr:hypothetical protein [Labilithrix sp.]MCW5814079.1 hypothetical protein [Labilithrix sp.]